MEPLLNTTTRSSCALDYDFKSTTLFWFVVIFTILADWKSNWFLGQMLWKRRSIQCLSQGEKGLFFMISFDDLEMLVISNDPATWWPNNRGDYRGHFHYDYGVCVNKYGLPVHNDCHQVGGSWRRGCHCWRSCSGLGEFTQIFHFGQKCTNLQCLSLFASTSNNGQPFPTLSTSLWYTF